MEITEILKIVESAEKRIADVRAMITDYNNCINSTSQQVLRAAITKFALPLKMQESQTVRSAE